MSEITQALRLHLSRVAPGWFWCGGCGRSSRPLSAAEANAVLGWGTSSGYDPRDTLVAIAILMECEVRLYDSGKCDCDVPVARAQEFPENAFHLYRLWADDGRLLYVGVTGNLRRRIARHRRANYGPLIASVTWEEHETAEAMLAAERAAIAAELPALNRQLV